jgi:hypothetical protein
MAVLVLDHPSALAPASFTPTVPREGRTLEDVISGAWEDLTAHRTATCPVCAAEMTPRYGSGPSAVGGRCNGCESSLT